MKHRRGRTDETWAMAITARNGLLRDNSNAKPPTSDLYSREQTANSAEKYLPTSQNRNGTNEVKQRSGEMR